MICNPMTGLLMISNPRKAATQDGLPRSSRIWPKGVTFPVPVHWQKSLTEARENRQQYQLVLHPQSTTLHLGELASLPFKSKTDSQIGTVPRSTLDMSIQPYVGPGAGGTEGALVTFGGQELSQAELEKRQKDVSNVLCVPVAYSVVQSAVAHREAFAT